MKQRNIVGGPLDGQSIAARSIYLTATGERIHPKLGDAICINGGSTTKYRPGVYWFDPCSDAYLWYPTDLDVAATAATPAHAGLSSSQKNITHLKKVGMCDETEYGKRHCACRCRRDCSDGQEHPDIGGSVVAPFDQTTLQ